MLLLRRTVSRSVVIHRTKTRAKRIDISREAALAEIIAPNGDHLIFQILYQNPDMSSPDDEAALCLQLFGIAFKTRPFRAAGFLLKRPAFQHCMGRPSIPKGRLGKSSLAFRVPRIGQSTRCWGFPSTTNMAREWCGYVTLALVLQHLANYHGWNRDVPNSAPGFGAFFRPEAPDIVQYIAQGHMLPSLAMFITYSGYCAIHSDCWCMYERGRLTLIEVN
jgi:hypothetical protein